MHDTATSAKADVVFPLETHAEKDGTVTHPDGRLQRVRPSASRPGDIRPNYLVLSELAASLGLTTGIDSQPTAFSALKDAVPFYASIDDATIGGRGIRWQSTSSASSAPSAESKDVGADGASEPGSPDYQRDGPASSSKAASDSSRRASADPGSDAPTAANPAASLTLGTYRDLWAGPITELNPPLRFLAPTQRLEISLADAERLSLRTGDPVKVSQNGTSVEATVQIRERVAEGVCFLAEGTLAGNANALLNGGPVKVEITKLSEVPA